jgi:hypothetical protein
MLVVLQQLLAGLVVQGGQHTKQRGGWGPCAQQHVAKRGAEAPRAAGDNWCCGSDREWTSAGDLQCQGAHCRLVLM